MELLRANLPWACVAAFGGVVAWLLLRQRAPEHGAPSLRRGRVAGDDAAHELTQLRAQLRDLEVRYHAQLDFFVTFPEVVKSLTAALTHEQVTSACSRGITALMHTRAIAILLAESRTHLRLVDGAGFAPQLRGELSCPVGEWGLVEVMTSRTISSLADHSTARERLAAHGLPVGLAVPLWYADDPLGLICVEAPPEDLPQARRLLAMLADLTAVGLHAARQVGKMRDEAEHDVLTGLANRRRLLERVRLELQRCASYGTRSSLAMIDVDHFKHYNDTNGHAGGDEVLRRVARLIAGATRRTDLVARYGGEEFTVILAGADRDQAFRHADRIRRAIAEHGFPNGSSQPLGHLSISVGIATFPEDATTVETLFEAADRALYRAKSGGRDRVVLHDPTAAR